MAQPQHTRAQHQGGRRSAVHCAEVSWTFTFCCMQFPRKTRVPWDPAGLPCWFRTHLPVLPGHGQLPACWLGVMQIRIPGSFIGSQGTVLLP